MARKIRKGTKKPGGKKGIKTIRHVRVRQKVAIELNTAGGKDNSPFGVPALSVA